MSAIQSLFLKVFVFASLLASMTASARTLRIGAEDDWYPFSGIVEGHPAGEAETIVTAAFRSQGITVQFVSLPYSRCLAEVEDGRLEACFDTVLNNQRQPHFLWPRHPLFRARVNVYMSADDPEQHLTIKKLEGRQVGVTNAYEYGEAFDADTAIGRSVSDQDVLLIRKLMYGRLRYIILYQKVADILQQRYPPLRGKIREAGKIADVDLYMVFSKVYPHAADDMHTYDIGVDTLIRTGEYQRIQQQWE